MEALARFLCKGEVCAFLREESKIYTTEDFAAFLQSIDHLYAISLEKDNFDLDVGRFFARHPGEEKKDGNHRQKRNMLLLRYFLGDRTVKDEAVVKESGLDPEKLHYIYGLYLGTDSICTSASNCLKELNMTFFTVLQFISFKSETPALVSIVNTKIKANRKYINDAFTDSYALFLELVVWGRQHEKELGPCQIEREKMLTNWPESQLPTPLRNRKEKNKILLARLLSPAQRPPPAQSHSRDAKTVA